MRIGIDLGGTKIEGIALDTDGQVLFRHRIATPRHDYTATLDAISTLVQQLETETQQHGSIGMGIPGTISPATGRVKNANSTWLIDQPLKQDLQQRLGREVRIANDANCFAVSEATDGAARDAHIMFGVIIGTGTGGGVCVAKRPLIGVNAIGGEWGHNPLPWPGDDERPGTQCYCGLHGCIETFLSGPGFLRDHQQHGGREDSPALIIQHAEDGEALAMASLQRYIDRMARALASIINVLDPEVIVLGGGMSKVKQLYTEVPQRWDRYVFSDRVDTKLVPPLHGDSSGVRGAAWLWPNA